MGSHQRSVKTKSFPGQSCDEKTLYRIHLGISGDAMQSFYFTYAIGDRKFCRILLWQKKCESYFGQQKMPSDTRIFSPLLYQLSYLGIWISCWKPLLI